MSDSETEALAAQELRRLQASARQLANTSMEHLGGAMLITMDPHGVNTTPHIHPKYDPREASLWMLGAFLAHLDESTPEETHPAEIADHALSLMDEYQNDDLVGWSIQDSENGGESEK